MPTPENSWNWRVRSATDRHRGRVATSALVTDMNPAPFAPVCAERAIIEVRFVRSIALDGKGAAPRLRRSHALALCAELMVTAELTADHRAARAQPRRCAGTAAARLEMFRAWLPYSGAALPI